MHLSDQDLKQLCQLAADAAIKAGHIIRLNMDNKKTVRRKTAGESEASQVVTQVDFDCQKAILKILSPSLRKYDLGLLSEEKKDNNSRFEKDYFWCIDPLDGTLPFIESKPGYSVNIALVSRLGISKIGVLLDPVNNVLYQSIINQGTHRNQIKWKPSTKKKSSFKLYIDRSFCKHPLYDVFLKRMKPLANSLGCEELKITDYGGGAMNAIWVMENSPSCYVKFPKPQTGGGSLWDFATTACIAKESGVYVSDIWGKPLELNRAESTFLNHKGVIYASSENLAQAIMLIFHEIAKTMEYNKPTTEF